jgi:hypothetical protein
MQALNFKPKCAGSVKPSEQSSAAAQSLLGRVKGRLRTQNNLRAALSATKPVLLLEKITGTILGGAAVTLMVGNVLVCVSMLLLGPQFVIELLAQINSLNI